MTDGSGKTGADVSARTQLRVLIVEDSEEDALRILRELRRGGYEPIHQRVDTTEAMDEALAGALAEGAPWDVVLSASRTACFSATGVLEKLRGAGSQAPFVVVSDKINDQAAVKAMRAGAHDYVTKDNLTHLCATIERGLERAKAQQGRERSLKSLAESEERYSRLVELSPDAVVVHAGGEVFFANSAGAKLFGAASAQELVGRAVMDLIHPDSRGLARDRIARTEHRGESTDLIQEKLLRLDGGAVDVEAASTPITDQGEAATLTIIRDITDRKRAEEELHRRQAILQAVAFAAERFLEKATFWEDGIEEVLGRLGRAAEASRVYIFENYTGHDGATWATQSYEWVALGVSAQIDNPVLNALPYRAAGLARWEDTLSRGEPLSGHLRQMPESERPGRIAQDIISQALVPIFVEGRWWGVFGLDECFVEREFSAAEIDALKAAADTLGAAIGRTRAERTLRESEERYRAVVEQAAEGIFLFDAATGELLESNAALRDLLGYTGQELPSMSIYDVAAQDPESVDSDVRVTLEEDGHFVGERQARRKDGSAVDVEVTSSLISYGGRQVICVVARDVTERVAAYRLLERRVRALAGIAASLTVDQPIQQTLSSLATSLVQASTGVACAVVLIDEEADKLHLVGMHGLHEEVAAAMEASWRAGAASPTLRAFHDHEPQLVRDARRLLLDDPLHAPAHPFIREAAWDTVLLVPLIYRGTASGVISINYEPGHDPTEEEIAFVSAIADQTAVAIENTRLFNAAQDKAAIEERQRLARELHDSVSQALYGIALGARTSRTLLDREASTDSVAEWLEYVLSLADAGLSEMRALIFELRPESLEIEGLIAALERQAQAVQARHEIPVHTALDVEPDLSLEAKEALYRIAQEAMHNAVKHARASGLELRLECRPGDVALELNDDGVGFDPEVSVPGHFGLNSMRERAARVSATLSLQSAPGEGTRVRLKVPQATRAKEH